MNDRVIVFHICCLPQVTASGPGLEKTGVVVNKWAEFTVDTRQAGHAPLHIAAMDADYNPVEVVIKDNKDGTFSCRYMPKKNVKHTVIISYGGINIPNSPFRVSGGLLYDSFHHLIDK